MAIEIGQVGMATVVVESNNTAEYMGSGTLPVFATPAMVALMEKAAYTGIQGDLGDGEGSVGICMETSHATITAMATVVAVDGRKVTFEVVAKEGEKIIGRGTHERFIINNEKFMAKIVTAQGLLILLYYKDIMMNTEEIKDVNIITTKNNKELEKRLKELSQELIEENYELYKDLENY